MYRTLRTCTLLSVVAALGAVSASAQMVTERFASGFSSPVYVTAPEGDTERLFVVEQGGLIKIIKNGVTLPTPFLDWSGPVFDGGNEQGLLGLAFHPDFDSNGFFYIYFTAGSSFISRSVIRGFQVSADPDVADPATIVRVFRWDQTNSNHNGGHIEFGPDGFLYVGLGDGGGAGDPFGAGQNGNELLGKMLRLDVDGDDFPADTQKNYAIPPSNPFVGNAAFLDEIWAYGMRNPYRWAFDELTGDIYIGDVGQNCWEEIDFQPASSVGGENYGWNIVEGNHCFTGGCNNPACGAGITKPIHEYDHNQDGFSCSLTGGRIYRGSAIPSMQGHYFYADFCSDQIYSFLYNGSSVSQLTNRTAQLDPPIFSISGITAFGKDGLGELYIVERSGEIFKILPDPVGAPIVAQPAGFGLASGSPNPFRTTTQFDLMIDRGREVTVSVYSAAGRLVRHLSQGSQSEGIRPVTWNGRDTQDRPVPSGVYFVRATSEGQVSTMQVTLLR